MKRLVGTGTEPKSCRKEPLYNQSNPLTQKTMESQDTQVSAEEMMEIDGAEDVSSDQGALATSTDTTGEWAGNSSSALGSGPQSPESCTTVDTDKQAQPLTTLESDEKMQPVLCGDGAISPKGDKAEPSPLTDNFQCEQITDSDTSNSETCESGGCTCVGTDAECESVTDTCTCAMIKREGVTDSDSLTPLKSEPGTDTDTQTNIKSECTLDAKTQIKSEAVTCSDTSTKSKAVTDTNTATTIQPVDDPAVSKTDTAVSMEPLPPREGQESPPSEPQPADKEIMYILVEFTGNHSYVVIPSNWRAGNQRAVWPPRSLAKPAFISKAVRKKIVPGDSWPSYPIRELYKSKTYRKALAKLAEIKVRSDLKTTGEHRSNFTRSTRRKQLRNKALETDDSTSDGTADKLHSARRSRVSTSRKKKIRSSPRPKLQKVSPVKQQSQQQQEIPQWVLKLMEQQAALIEELKDVKMELACLKNMMVVKQDEEPSQLEFSFPLNTLEEMAFVEKQLNEAKTEKAALDYLSVIGGSTVKEVTINILREMMTRNLAMKYNWTGARSKCAFSTLRLKCLLQKAVRQNRKTTDATNTDIKRVAQEWLRGASDREGGRTRRKTLTASKSDPNTP